MGPYPLTVAGTWSPPSSVSSVITRLTATGSAAPAGRPVTRSNTVSAMTAPRERSSKVVSALRLGKADEIAERRRQRRAAQRG